MTISFRDGRLPRAAWLLCFCVAGCQSKADVSGKVTFHGQTVVFGTVLLEASDGSLHQANIDQEGNFAVGDISAGPVKVAVSSRNPTSSDFQLLRLEGDAPAPPRTPIPGWFPIPEKYETPGTSGLEYSIQRGPNTINVELVE